MWGSGGAWCEWVRVPRAPREGHRGHAGHTWGPTHPSVPGPGRVGARGGVPGSSQDGARPRRWACGEIVGRREAGDRGQARVQRPAGFSRSPGDWPEARERKWLLGGRQPQAGRCAAEPRFPTSPSRVGRAHPGLQLAPALPARGWEPRQLARAAGEAGPRAGSPPLPAGPLPQVPSRAPRAARAARSPPPARPGTPRRWARPAEDKVRRRRGDARVRLEGAEWRRTRLGSVPPDRVAGLGQPPVKRSRSSGAGGARLSPAGFPLRSIPVRARRHSPGGQGRWARWSRGARPTLAPSSRRPRGSVGLGRRAAAGAPPPGCWMGTTGSSAMASSTWRSTRRCPSPSRARGPAPVSPAAVSTPPASATRAGWGTSANTARAGSSKCLRPIPNLSPASHPSRSHPPRRAAPSSPAATGTPGPRGAREREAFPDDQHFHTQLRCQTPFC